MFSLHTCSMRTAVSLARVSTGSQVRSLRELCPRDLYSREIIFWAVCPVYSSSDPRAVPLVISKSLARARPAPQA